MLICTYTAIFKTLIIAHKLNTIQLTILLIPIIFSHQNTIKSEMTII